MDVARDDKDLLVVTENGYGKRTQIDQYRKTARGAKGVRTIKLTEARAASPARWSCASTRSSCSSRRAGMVQRTGVARHLASRAAPRPGVRVMNIARRRPSSAPSRSWSSPSGETGGRASPLDGDEVLARGRATTAPGTTRLQTPRARRRERRAEPDEATAPEARRPSRGATLAVPEKGGGPYR